MGQGLLIVRCLFLSCINFSFVDMESRVLSGIACFSDREIHFFFGLNLTFLV